MRPDVADVAEHKADEHEEKADQRERSGRADHLCKQADKKSTSVLLCFSTVKLRVKLLACFFLVHWGLFPSAGQKSIVSLHAFKNGDGRSCCAHEACVCSVVHDVYHVMQM